MESDFSVDYAASVDINIIFHFIIGPAVSGNFKNRTPGKPVGVPTPVTKQQSAPRPAARLVTTSQSLLAAFIRKSPFPGTFRIV